METVKTASIHTNKSTNTAFMAVVFVLWPFIGCLLAMKDFQSKLSKTIILLFLMLFGLLFYVNPLQDSQRRADSLKEAYMKPFEAVYETFDKLYEETVDFVEPIIIYSVSRISDYHGVLFAVYAFIFGSLMLYYLKVMHQHYLSFSNKNALLFLILLIFSNPINEINGFRMWTAAWFFSVGVLNYLHFKKWKHLLFASFAVFIHFSFLPLIGVLLIYVLAGNRVLIYGSIAIITFFIAELNIEQLRGFAELLGTASEKKALAYTSDVHIEDVKLANEQASLFLKFNDKGMLYFQSLLLLLIYFKTRGFFKNKITDNFYSISLLILSFANIASLIPGGQRFYKVFNIFVFSTFLLYYVYEFKKPKLTFTNVLSLPVVLLFIIVVFRLFTESASIYLFGPSFFMLEAFYDNISLKSILF